jgi:hypothetical protein
VSCTKQIGQIVGSKSFVDVCLFQLLPLLSRPVQLRGIIGKLQCDVVTNTIRCDCIFAL